MQQKLQALSYYRWLVFGVVATGTFMATLTSSIVNVALPPITASLKITIATAQWIVTAYLLAIASLLPLMGRLGDIWGRKRVYGSSFIIFITGSLLCALAPSASLLIAARIVQAVGAAALMANAPAIVTNIFPPNARGKVLGMIGTVVALGTLTGPSLGGLLVSSLGWNSIFLVNIPIGLLAYIGVRLVLPPDQSLLDATVDYTGAALFAVAITAFLLMISFGGAWGWLSGTTSTVFVFAVLVFWLFVRQEKKTPYPMIDLTIFRNRLFLAGNLSGLCSFMALFANTIMLPFYLHDILQYSPASIGLVMSAFPLAMAITAPVSGSLSDRIGPVALTTSGLGLMAAGLFLLTRLEPASGIGLIMLLQAIMGIGNGMFQSPNNSSVMGAVEIRHLGTAGGINALARNLGMVLGTTIAVSIFGHVQQIMLAPLPAPSALETQQAFMAGYHSSLLTAAGFAVVGAFLSLNRKK